MALVFCCIRVLNHWTIMGMFDSIAFFFLFFFFFVKSISHVSMECPLCQQRGPAEGGLPLGFVNRRGKGSVGGRVLAA